MPSQQLAVHRARFVDYTPGNITALSFSHQSSMKSRLTPSDLRLAIGRSNGDIEIWNPRNNWAQEFLIHGGKDRSIEGLCWSNISGEPLRLFSIGGSTVVTEWDLATGLPLKNYDCNAGVIWSLAINNSQNKLSVGCDNGTVVIIDISGGPGVLEHDTILTRQESRILSVTWNDDNYVIGGCSDGRIRVWNVMQGNLERGKLLHTMKVDKAKRESTLVWSVLYLPLKNQIVSGDSTGSVKFWDFQYATLLQTFNPHNADVLCLTSDATNSNVFSAGVDRKIFQFSHHDTKKWVNSSNRLLHGNDIRSIASYQSNGADFLVSGGLEKTFVITSLSSFAHGNYRKMPFVNAYNKNVLVNGTQRFVVMWENNKLIKVWRVGQDRDENIEHNYKLVCKLTLKDEENITTCAMSPDGQVLIVGRSSNTKVFFLQPTNNGNKLKITKLDNDLLLKTGSKLIKFIDNSQVVICTHDDILFKLDLESDEDEEMDELKISDLPKTKSSIKVPYLNKINHIDACKDYVIVSRACGAVDVVSLSTGNNKSLVRLMNSITVIKINEKKSTVIVMTADNKVYELNVNVEALNKDSNQKKQDETNEDEDIEMEEDFSEGVFTQWSKNNVDNLPKRIQTLKEKCNGIIIDQSNPNLIWFWGSTWISRLDFSVDLPLKNTKKSKKRSREGLTITDESNFMDSKQRNDEDDEDEDDEDDIDMDNLNDILPHSSKNENTDQNRAKSESQVFYFNDKYKPNLCVNFIGTNELITVERPMVMVKSSKAFDLPKLVF
ncbi:U3 small nucleolar RNA-associated protein 4 [Monosporozyma unispora]|nr:U3 small nucleolar RNA-associated protein [Kazachstania unispora]